MPLENTSRNYFYCAPQVLPPLPPRKKKVKSCRANNKNNNTTEPAVAAAAVNTPIVPTSILSSAGTTTNAVNTRRHVHWPDGLDQHMRVVEFNKADAKFAGIIGSPFEGEWYFNALEYAPSTPYNPPLPPQKKKVNTYRTTNNSAVVVPTILFPTVPEEDVEEMDWEPILDEVSPRDTA